MERLTEKCWRNLDPWECCGQDKYCQRGCHDEGGCTNGCEVPKIYCKLAKYEDLEEQCIAENQCGIGELLLKWKEFFDDIAELYEYRKAEEQGLLHKFSCRAGDIIYFVTSRDILRKVVINIKIDEDGIEYYASGIVFRDENIGECIFLSEAEAETALAEKGE